MRLFDVTRTLRPGMPTYPGEPGPEIAAVRAAVLRALNVLTRVLGISHLDDPAFPSLLDCQAKASELRVAVSRAGIEVAYATADSSAGAMALGSCM